MSKSLHSPTARLLQSSRLFSLPRPLPLPALDLPSAIGTYKASDTATLPYPIYQALASPASSRSRGDWGLKRPLPQKTTNRTSTPSIRVRAQDTSAHITDFQSAADHVQTEAKWRQMGIPLVMKHEKHSFTDSKNFSHSVYDDNVDITDPVAASFRSPVAANTSEVPFFVDHAAKKTRWKYKGPWIPGMDEVEFLEYMARKVAKRRPAFRAFLTKRIVEKHVRDEEKANREKGYGGALTPARVKEIRRHVMNNYETEEKILRDEHMSQHLGSELTAAICDFLDLPGVHSGQRMTSIDLGEEYSNLSLHDGPPSTHPGAGLSYLRSNAFMENHPHWGPQAHHTPVKARVLRPRSLPKRNELNAKLGVAGVVTKDAQSGSGFKTAGRKIVPAYDGEHLEEHYLDAERMASVLDENLPGGNKLWVHPVAARIDLRGRIDLHVTRGDKEAIAVRRNKVQEIHDAKAASFKDPASARAFTPGKLANYGHSLPDTRQMRQPRSRVSGFDEELQIIAGQKDSEPVAAISKLMRESMSRQTP